MKKILSVLFVLISVIGYSQTPYPTPPQQLGAKTVLVKVPGGLGIDSMFYAPRYADTATANIQRTKLYAGSIIFTLLDNSFWVRSADATRWLFMGNGIAGATTNSCPRPVISGGIVTYSNALTLDVTTTTICVSSKQYTAQGDSVNLAAADPTLPRQDLIVVDTFGLIYSITGTPNADPAEPSYDPSYQVALVSVNIAAGATVPTGVSAVTLWDENLGQPTELTATAVGLTVNYNGVTNPYHLLKTGDVGSITNGDYLRYNGTTSFSTSDYNALKMFIRLKSSLANATSINVTLINGLLNLTAPITIGTLNGFNKTTTGTYQNVTIPLADFVTLNGTDLTTFTGLRIDFVGTNGGLYVDYITLNGGLPTGGGGNTVNGITNIYRIPGTDSVMKVVNGVATLAYRDSIGAGSGVTVISYGKNATRDSTILLLSNGTRYAAKDSIGSGGGSGSIEYILQGYGMKVDSAGRVYTVRVDSTVISNHTRTNKAYYTIGQSPDSSYFTIRDLAGRVDTVSVVSDGSGGGGSGVTKAQTPLRITGTDTVTIKWNMLDYVGAGYVAGTTDATAAIQAAINAADASGLGGDVIIPAGVHKVAGAILAGCNCQIYIPVRSATDTLRNHITIKGEVKASFLPTGGGLDITGLATMIKGTSVLYSTLSTFTTAGQSVIGTDRPGGSGTFNETFLSIENISIRVKNNPSGTGPVVGGVSYKNGGGMNIKNSVAYIDTSAGVSVLPQNDVTGFEFPDNGAETMNSLENTIAVGFRNGYKIAEHTSIVKSDAWCNYYAYYFKIGNHLTTAQQMQSYWNVNDIYIGGTCMLGNLNLNTEWQDIGKWYDNVTTIIDTASMGRGNIFYTIRNANGIGGQNGNYRFTKSGGDSLYATPHDYQVVTLSPIKYFETTSSIFGINKTTSGNFGLNLSSSGVGTNTYLQFSSPYNVPKWYINKLGSDDRLSFVNSDINGNTEVLSIAQNSVDAVSLKGNNSGRVSFTAQNTNSSGNTSFYFQNNTGGYADYGGLGHFGTAAASSWFGATRASKTFVITDGNSTGMLIGSLNSSALTLGTNNTAGVTVSTAQLVRFHAYGAGTLVTDGSGNITASSSKLVKHNILSLKYGLNEIKQIEPSTYIRNADSSNTVEPGFIAENIQDVFGGLGVGKSKDGVLSLNTNVILAAAVNAIKEMDTKLEDHQKIIESLEKRIKYLENKK